MTCVQQGHTHSTSDIMCIISVYGQRKRQSFMMATTSTGHFSVVAAVMAGCHVTTILVLRGDLRGESGILNMIGLSNETLNSMRYNLL